MEFYKLFNNITLTERCERYATNYKLLKKKHCMSYKKRFLVNLKRKFHPIFKAIRPQCVQMSYKGNKWSVKMTYVFRCQNTATCFGH